MLVEMLQQNTALTERVEALLKQNTELTETVRTLVERIDAMTTEVHTCVAPAARELTAPSRRRNRLLVDELDRLLERGGRDLEQAGIGHAEFEDEKDRKRDRQRSEGKGRGNQGVARGV